MTKTTLQTTPVNRLRRRLTERIEFLRQRREHDVAMSIPGVAAEHDTMMRRSGSSCPFCS